MCFSHKYYFLLLLAMLISFSSLHARIINVPEDHETIQEGINASDNRDTVLVQPGIYVENIVISEKNIVLGSLFLTTGNGDYIDSTIIDGNEQGSVVRIFRGDTTTAFSGFTIRNGHAEEYGGGIYLGSSSTKLSNLIVKDNVSGLVGGGIYLMPGYKLILEKVTVRDNHCQGSGGGIFISSWNAEFYDCHILNNVAESRGGGLSGVASRSYFFGGSIVGNSAELGGGIYVSCGPRAYCSGTLIQNNHAVNGGGVYIGGESQLNLSYTLLIGNRAEENGGGVCIWGGREKIFTNVTAVNNFAERGAGFYVGARNTTFRNCIIWKNGHTNISANSSFGISYSDVQGGIDGFDLGERGQVEWGEGNIDTSPLFMSHNDFHLSEHSPCINTGDPDSPPEIDNSRADIGGFPFLVLKVLEGYITDAADGSPIEGCTVTTSFDEDVISDDEGYWSIETYRPEFTIRAQFPGYNPSVIHEVQFDNEDNLSIDIQMLHPEFRSSTHELGIELAEGDSIEIPLIISNDANGYLEWELETNRIIGDDYKPWDIRQSIPVSQEVDNLRIQGAVLIDNRFYVAGRGEEEHLIYVLDRTGEEIDRFQQPGESRNGMYDLAWDGELIWGSDQTGVHGFTPDGTSRINWQVPRHQVRTLAWDPDRDVLWISSFTGSIKGYSRMGEVLYNLRNYGLYKYGLAYWPFDPDGCPLYVLYKEPWEKQALCKINPDSNEMIFVKYLTPPEGGSPVGAFITHDYDNTFSTVLLTISNLGQQNRGDVLNVWQMDTPDFWIDVKPKSGIILPGATGEITVSLRTYDPIRDISLSENLYDAYLNFTHNAAGGGAVIPVAMIVGDPNAVHPENDMHPKEFEITSVYPNPFNSAAKIGYSLPERSDVSIKVFDLAGRVIETLLDTNQTTGLHSVTWDAGGVASGLYLVQVATDRDVRSQKIILTQ